MEAVSKWKQSKNPTEVQSFLGLAGYYWRLVYRFLKIAAPITALIRKDVKLEWTEACEQGFQELKR